MMGKGSVHLSICPKITGEFTPETMAQEIDL